jgi:hypothetical protein
MFAKLQVRKSLEFFSQHSSWQKLVDSNSTAVYRLYWINAGRSYTFNTYYYFRRAWHFCVLTFLAH